MEPPSRYPSPGFRRLARIAAFLPACLAFLACPAGEARGQAALEPQGFARIRTTPAVIGGTMHFTLEGTPGAPYLLALDLAPGSVPVPGLGLVHLALSPLLMFPLNSLEGAPPIPASSLLAIPVPIAGTDGSTAYLQAAVGSPAGTALSNGASIRFSLPDSYPQPQNPMSVPRAFHRAVELPNSSVLVIGGGSGAFLTPVASAQCDRYNPYLRTFAPDASMASPRTLHTATGLADGRVLVAGGSLTLGIGLDSTEIYDPVVHAWGPGPTLSSNRIAHAATRLQDGRVLITGGTTTFDIPAGSTNYLPIFQGSLATAEIYDPSTGQIIPAANAMSSARMAHTAVLLDDGRVLVAGGIRGGQVVFGVSAPLYAQTADLFDPATNQFTPVAGPAIPRVAHTANRLPDGTVLVIGGAGGTLVATLSSSEIFDPVANQWAPGPALGQGTLALHSATALPDGTLYVAGGAVGAVGSFSAVDAAYRYSTASGFVPLQPLPVPVQALTATWTDAGVLLLGGGVGGSSGTPTAAAAIWTPNL